MNLRTKLARRNKKEQVPIIDAMFNQAAFHALQRGTEKRQENQRLQRAAQEVKDKAAKGQTEESNVQ